MKNKGFFGFNYLFSALLAIASIAVVAAVPQDGTYRIIQPAGQFSIVPPRIEIQNNEIVGASGLLIEPHCHTQNASVTGEASILNQMFDSAHLANFLTAGEGNFIISNNAIITQEGLLTGLIAGTDKALYAEILFDSDTAATMTLHTAYASFTGRGLQTEPCITQIQFEVEPF